MLANGLGQFLEWTEATARCPATPPAKFSFGILPVRAGIKSLESFTKTHRTAKFRILTTEVFTLLLTLLTEIGSVAAQAPHRTFEIGSFTLKLATHLIECLAGKHHDVELVENDPGMRKVLRST